MGKKILLYSPDNVPNVALMKLSTYHKRMGDTVYPLNATLWAGEADKIYVSCIFPENMKKVPAFPEGKTEYGGVGYDFIEEEDGYLKQLRHTWLSEEINHQMPNYDLYGIKYSMGFTSRGCIRSCKFCVVQKHEGKIRATNDIYEFYDKRFNIIRILDNNPLALKDHFCKIGEQIVKEKLYGEFDGLDSRVLCDDTAKILAKIRTVNEKLKFALDLHESINSVVKGIELLIKYNAFHKTLWYVLLDAGETIEQEVERIKVLMFYNSSIYPMFFNNRWRATDKLLRGYPYIEVLKMRTDSRILRKFNRYLAYKLGFYDKYRFEVKMDKLEAFQKKIYDELGWTDRKFIGINELREKIGLSKGAEDEYEQVEVEKEEKEIL